MKDPDRPVPLDTVSGGGGVAGGGEEDKGGVRSVGSSGAGNSWNGSDQMMQGKWCLYFLESIWEWIQDIQTWEWGWDEEWEEDVLSEEGQSILTLMVRQPNPLVDTNN